MRYVRLRGFAGVMGCVQGVGMSGVRVMSGRLMMSGGVVPGGFLVMLRRVLVMFGGLGMMGVRGVTVRRFLRHRSSPLLVSLNSAEGISFPGIDFFVAERGTRCGLSVAEFKELRPGAAKLDGREDRQIAAPFGTADYCAVANVFS